MIGFNNRQFLKGLPLNLIRDSATPRLLKGVGLYTSQCLGALNAYTNTCHLITNLTHQEFIRRTVICDTNPARCIVRATTLQAGVFSPSEGRWNPGAGGMRGDRWRSAATVLSCEINKAALLKLFAAVNSRGRVLNVALCQEQMLPLFSRNVWGWFAFLSWYLITTN